MKININTLQLIKFGSYIGSAPKLLDNSNLPYVYGIKNGNVLIDPNTSLVSLKQISLLSKKANAKNDGVYILNSSRKDRYIFALKEYLNKINVNNIKNLGTFKSGIVSNKEIRKNFSFFKKKEAKKILSRHGNIFGGRVGYIQEGSDRKNYSTNIYPSLAHLLRFDKNYLSELRKSKILSSVLLDTNNFHHAADYNVLYNNKSTVSTSFLIKLLKN